MSVTVEHFAYGTDDGFVSVGIAVRHRQTPGGDPCMDFVAEVDLAKGEAKGLVEALRSTNCAEFNKARGGGHISIIKKRCEGTRIMWYDNDRGSIIEPFTLGVDGWSERFAEDIDRAIREARRCRQTRRPSRTPPWTIAAGVGSTTGVPTVGRTVGGMRSAACAEPSARSSPGSIMRRSA